MAINFTRTVTGINFAPQDTIAPSVDGDVRYNSSTNKLELFNGTVDPIVTTSQVAPFISPIANNTFIGNVSGITATATAVPAADVAVAILPSQTGEAGNFLTTDGTTASWAAGGAGGANTSLSNLASTAINVSLWPASPDAIDLGSSGETWRNVYAVTYAAGTWNGSPINLTTYGAGTLQSGQFPALTGDITTTAGSLATSLVATTNATITTLSSLSLPYSQITGAPAAAPTQQIFTSGSGTYTLPAGCLAIKIRMTGGGGGGGGTPSTTSGQAAVGGGGGAGAYLEKYITSPASTYAYAVGAGGTGISGSGGNTGDATTFGISFLTAAAGLGASGGSASSTNYQRVFAGTGGVATGGDVNVTGGAGQIGVVFSTSSPILVMSGFGGSNSIASGGPEVSTGAASSAFAGANGNGYGGGGSGSVSTGTSSAEAGGTGASGIIIVEEFY